jgi:Ca-activated chloride channel family protein
MKTAYVVGLLGCLGVLGAMLLPGQTFKSEARLVEVYASVHDNKGNYIDGLVQERFQILDDGSPRRISSFESEGSNLTTAILLDTTGSMQEALPAVKNAVSTLLDQMRDGDTVGVFGFSTSLTALQDFTTDKAAAKRAVLRARAGGETALFDSVAEIAKTMAARSGKKAVVLFTDGDDNASGLTAEAASRSVLKTGIPVYAVAEGEARHSAKLIKQLRSLADLTGGSCHEVHSLREVQSIFLKIQGELQHLYLLSYTPPAGDPTKWRTIKVLISGNSGYEVRGKQGYFPE